MQLTIVAGARPNFMKVAPIMLACAEREVNFRFVHTGQHYDQVMSDDFISVLGIPQSNVNLGIGSGTDGYQCGEAIKRCEKELVSNRPELLVVVGDVNSTLGSTLAASKLDIPVAHVEAGLRSFNRQMPEEINRVVVDSLAELLFITEESGRVNLLREGRPEECIHLVGNTMIDSLIRILDTYGESDIQRRLGLERDFCYVTLHRPSNVDSPIRLKPVLEMIRDLSDEIDIVLPVHPRTGKNIKEAGLSAMIKTDNIKAISPISYLDSITLISNAKLVVTDSGGIQEETTFLKTPCLTLRKETERPVTTQMGTNLLVTDDCYRIIDKAFSIIAGSKVEGEIPPFWDGLAGQRIVDILLSTI